MKRVADILEIALLIIMLAMCGMILMAGQGNVPYVFGYRVMQVISDSMRPTIAAETCIVIKKVDEIGDIQVGDVITFVSEDPRIEGFHNTHRVSDIITDAETGEILFQTKGDAYETPDAQLVSFDQITGRFVGELPFGEYLYKGIIFLTDRVNYFIVVIAPLFLCFLSYFKQLLLALFRPASDYEDDEEEDELEDGEEYGENSGETDKENSKNNDKKSDKDNMEENINSDEISITEDNSEDAFEEQTDTLKEKSAEKSKDKYEDQLDEELKAELEEKVKRELLEAIQEAAASKRR